MGKSLGDINVEVIGFWADDGDVHVYVTKESHPPYQLFGHAEPEDAYETYRIHARGGSSVRLDATGLSELAKILTKELEDA